MRSEERGKARTDRDVVKRRKRKSENGPGRREGHDGCDTRRRTCDGWRFGYRGIRSSRLRKYTSISDASKSETGAGEPGDDGRSTLPSPSSNSLPSLPPLSVIGSGGFAGFLPSRCSRLRRALTGCRSTAEAGPAIPASRGGTERTVKCSTVRV